MLRSRGIAVIAECKQSQSHKRTSPSRSPSYTSWECFPATIARDLAMLGEYASPMALIQGSKYSRNQDNSSGDATSPAGAAHSPKNYCKYDDKAKIARATPTLVQKINVDRDCIIIYRFNSYLFGTKPRQIMRTGNRSKCRSLSSRLDRHYRLWIVERNQCFAPKVRSLSRSSL